MTAPIETPLDLDAHPVERDLWERIVWRLDSRDPDAQVDAIEAASALAGALVRARAEHAEFVVDAAGLVAALSRRLGGAAR